MKRLLALPALILLFSAPFGLVVLLARAIENNCLTWVEDYIRWSHHQWDLQ